MCGEPYSPAWRLSALLLGASWVVTLAVACGGGGGGGDDEAVATPLASGVFGAAGSGTRTEAGAMAATLPPQAQARMQEQAPGNRAATLPVAQLQPCDDESRRLAQSAAVPAHPPALRVRGDALDDAAANSAAGPPGAGAAGADPPADPFEAE